MEVIAKFDTVTKKLVVTQDGVPVDNLTSLDFYISSYYDDDYEDGKNKFRMNLCQDTRDNVNKISKRMVSIANYLGNNNEN